MSREDKLRHYGATDNLVDRCCNASYSEVVKMPGPWIEHGTSRMPLALMLQSVALPAELPRQSLLKP